MLGSTPAALLNLWIDPKCRPAISKIKSRFIFRCPSRRSEYLSKEFPNLLTSEQVAPGLEIVVVEEYMR